MLKIIQSIEPWSFLLGMIAGVFISIAALCSVWIWLRDSETPLDEHDNEYSFYSQD